MDMFIKIAFLVVFFGVMIGVGIYCRKQSTDVNGFVLGNRSVGPWLTAFAFGTSYFSAVIFVGYAGQFGWKFGMASTWIGLGNAFIGSLLAWNILGRRTRVMTQHLDSATMPDFFMKRYDSKALKITASIIIFIFLIPYTASLYNGLSRLFEMAFGIPYWVCVIVMSVLTAVYVVLGGYMATAINDFIQGLIMIGGIIAVIFAVMRINGGLGATITLLSKETAAGTDMQGAFTSFLGPDIFGLIGVVLLTSLGTWGLPQMVQKFYAIKSEKSISTGTIVSTVFAVIVAGGCYFLGGFGRLFGTAGEGGMPEGGYDSIIPTMLEQLSPVLIGIVVILVLSASMSTLSSLVLTSSSVLTIDFIDPVFRKGKPMDDKKKVFIMRIFIVFFIAISAAIAIIQASSKVTFIAQMMGVSWGALAGAFLAPFLYGLYMKRVPKLAVWVNFVLGIGISMASFTCSMAGIKFDPVTQPLLSYFQSPINAGMLAMVMGLIITPLIALIHPAKDKDRVSKIFECYNKKFTVSSKHSIDEE